MSVTYFNTNWPAKVLGSRSATWANGAYKNSMLGSPQPNLGGGPWPINIINYINQGLGPVTYPATNAPVGLGVAVALRWGMRRAIVWSNQNLPSGGGG